MTSPWQPIATVNTAHTVDLFARDVEHGILKRYPDCRWVDFGFGPAWCSMTPGQATMLKDVTHWMPIPMPPFYVQFNVGPKGYGV